MAGMPLSSSLNKIEKCCDTTKNKIIDMEEPLMTTIFNIRGTIFETHHNNLKRLPNSLLAGLDTASSHYNREKKEYFFDRDAQIFNCILNLLSTGEMHVPKNVCVRLLREEMQFWGIPLNKVAPCCWRLYFQLDEDAEILSNLQAANRYDTLTCDYHDLTWRKRLWILLDQPASSTLAKVWHGFYLICVLVTACILCMWTLDEFRTDHYLSVVEESDFDELHEKNMSRLVRFLEGDPILPLMILDILCLLVFTIEIVIQISVCPSKVQFLKRPLNVVSLVVIISMWVGVLFEFNKSWMAKSYAARILYFFCKAVAATRLILFIRLEKLFGPLRVLIMSIKSSLIELSLMTIVFVIATVIFASLIFFAEVETENGIHSIFIGMWWAIITMSTVGYGDYYPKSLPGYVVGVACAFCGLMLIAMPIAVIASNFSEYYKQNKDLKRAMALAKEMESPQDLPMCKSSNKNECTNFQEVNR